MEWTKDKLSTMFQNFAAVYQALERGTTQHTATASIYPKINPPSYTSLSGVTKYARYKMPKCHFLGYNMWIFKPTGLNRGRGIHVFRSIDALKDLIVSYIKELSANEKKKPDPLANAFVIQKYIESPLLVCGRKFDIRMWALITPEMDGYLFREGYIRTSSSPYIINNENVDDKFVHLTNNAVQKFSDSYGSFEDGNQMSFERFREYLKGDIVDKVILPQIKNLVIKSFLSVRKKLNPAKSRSSLEIFGYDFIIDSDYNVWLIEVNTNPCLEESSGILKVLLPRMVDDAFKLTLDKAFPRLKEYEKWENIHKYSVKGYDDEYNMWYAISLNSHFLQ